LGLQVPDDITVYQLSKMKVGNGARPNSLVRRQESERWKLGVPAFGHEQLITNYGSFASSRAIDVSTQSCQRWIHGGGGTKG